MFFYYVVGLFVLAYFISKTLSSSLENENEQLRKQLVTIKTEKQKEYEAYQKRVKMLNDTINNYKGGNGY